MGRWCRETVAFGECDMAAREVTIVICYQAGTGRMLKACLSSIKRHTKYPHRVWLVAAEPDNAMFTLVRNHNLPLLENPKVKDEHNVHGALLDWAIHGIGHDDELILTLDSDCFPVADGWLQDLHQMMQDGARIVGILRPWAPPPLTMQKAWILCLQSMRLNTRYPKARQ